MILIDMTHPTRRLLLQSSAVALLAGLAGCTTTDIPAGTGDDQSASALPMVNELRKKRGLSALSVDRAASTAALHQAHRMAKVGKMSHLIGFNDDFGKRMKGQGVTLPAAENIAVGQSTTDEAVLAWINSPKHLANMLGSFHGIGVAVARIPASENRPYWAMVLSG